MSKPWEFNKRNWYKVVSLIVVLSGIYVLWSFYQSSKLINLAGQLNSENKAEEALTLYTQAQRLAPYRTDLPKLISGAALIVQSNKEYGQLTGVDEEIENAEIQTLPPVSTPLEKVVAPGQVVIPVLMYHHIEVNPRPYNALWASLFVTPDQLNQQFKYLLDHHFHPIFLEELYSALKGTFILPDHPIVLTFDDGYRSFYTNAFPLLKKYHFKATQFMITAVTTYPAYSTWDQVIEMDRSDLVEMAAHTRHHPDLTQLSKASINIEVKGSKSDIEDHLHKPIHWFAYPYGTYNNTVIQAVKDAGFLGAASVIYGYKQSLDSIYLMPRIMVDGRFSINEFASRVNF